MEMEKVIDIIKFVILTFFRENRADSSGGRHMPPAGPSPGPSPRPASGPSHQHEQRGAINGRRSLMPPQNHGPSAGQMDYEHRNSMPDSMRSQPRGLPQRPAPYPPHLNPHARYSQSQSSGLPHQGFQSPNHPPVPPHLRNQFPLRPPNQGRQFYDDDHCDEYWN